ncbi:MAG: tetratricopeptide repeat protein [Ginsengibacter sp.]
MTFFKILFSTIFVTAVACGCKVKNFSAGQESFKLTKQSDVEIKSKNFDSAAILIAKALAMDSNNYIAYNNRAYLKREQNKPSQEIIDDYKKALTIAPEYEIALYSLTNYYSEIREYQNTINLANRYLSLQLSQQLDSEQMANIYYKLANSEEKLLQFDQAIIDFKKAIEIKPANKYSHFGLGECYYYGSNDIPAALAEFTEALDIDSTYAVAYIEREKCDRNSKPPLLKQAESDAINANRYETKSKNKNDTTGRTFERARKSLNPKVAEADAFYKSIHTLYLPAKVANQNLIDNIVADLTKIQNKSTANVDIKYLRKLVDDALAANTNLLNKLKDITEIDSAIDCKKKLFICQKSFQILLVSDMPKFIDILQYANNYRFTAAMDAIKTNLTLIHKQNIEFEIAENELFNKYTLH